MKRLIVAFFLIALVCLFVCTAYAAETVTVAGDMTIQKAIEALGGEGGTIVIAEPASVTRGFTIPEQTGDLTIKGAEITVGGNITIEKNTNDNTVIFDMPLKVKSGKARIFGGFNSVKFTENFTVTGEVEFYGGVNVMTAGNSACTDIPTWTKNSMTCVTELPYSITVDGGTFSVFEGGNFRSDLTCLIGSVAAPLEITVNGGTFGKGVSFGADSALQIEQVFSVSGMNILADDATLTINGGTFNCPIYVLGYMGQTCTTAENNSQYVNSDKKFYAADGNITVNINGGTFNTFEMGAAQNAATYSQLLRGNYKVNIKSDAKLQSGMVFDATQVKAYEGSDKKAEITYPSSAKIEIVRFDTENGKAKTYKEPERFAFIGDSITQGTGVTGSNFEEYAYPAQLLKKMVSLGEDVIVSNYGCGATKVMDYSGLGYTTGLTYKLSMEETDADIVVIALGTNDASVTSYSYAMCQRFYEEYKAFAKGYANLPCTDMVYCTSAIYRVGTDIPAVSAIRASQENAARELNAEGEKCKYLDLYGLTLDEALRDLLLSSDNLHPHANGYAIFTEEIYNAIRNGVTEQKNLEMTDIYVSASGRNNGAGTKADPTSNISVAFAKAADEAVIHIIGEYNYTKVNNAEYGFQTPANVKKLTIVGEGDGAKLTVNGKNVFVNSDIVFDNITLESSAGALTILLGFHNATFTETFKCDKAILAAGAFVYGSNKTSGFYSSEASADSDKDCVININGGDYMSITGGNLLTGKDRNVAFGTYSGNMEINIGKGATVSASVNNGAVGQNYLTGSVTVNVGAWTNEGVLREFIPIGATNGAKNYDETRNTGSVTVNVLDGVNAKVAITGDINADGTVNLADALVMLSDALAGKNVRDAQNYYGMSKFKTDNVERLLASMVK